MLKYSNFVAFALICARAPRERASLRECARVEGAGPRGARDEKLVPDIYLTLPGSTDAPRPGVSAVRSGTTEVDVYFFFLSLSYSFSPTP